MDDSQDLTLTKPSPAPPGHECGSTQTERNGLLRRLLEREAEKAVEDSTTAVDPEPEPQPQDMYICGGDLKLTAPALWRCNECGHRW